jgi:plastocyanin
VAAAIVYDSKLWILSKGESIMIRYTAKVIGFIMLISIGLAIMTGCGSSKKSTNPPPPAHSANFHTVSIANFAFSPPSLTIAAGDTVLWTNNQNVTHTVTSDAGTELGGSLSPGATYQHIFMTANSFPYHCSIHPTMHGLVTVQ